MARTKKSETKKTDRKQRAEMLTNDLRNRFSNLSKSRSYTSLAYGIITLVVLFALGFAAFRLITQDNTPDIAENGIDNAINEVNEDEYVVQEGDTLWSIAEQEYQDGYAWSDIAEANNLSNPNNLEAGTRLTLPDDRVTPEAGEATAQAQPEATDAPEATPTEVPVTETPTVTTAPEAPQQNGAEITGTEYTVAQGDTLWDIAVRAYDNGYRWTEIAQANGITNPDLIYVGTTFKLQR